MVARPGPPRPTRVARRRPETRPTLGTLKLEQGVAVAKPFRDAMVTERRVPLRGRDTPVPVRRPPHAGDRAVTAR